jgi:S1-C subfamily serine protease
VTAIDWIIVIFTLLMACYGYLQGFVVGALSLIGFGLGALIGTRIGPLLLSGGAHSRYAPLFGLLGALLAGGILAAGFEGVGAVARSVIRFPGLQLIDGLAGAALTGAVGLGIAWIVGAVALQSSGSLSLRRDIQRSVILRALNDVLPPSSPVLNALARFDPLPSVSGPGANVRPPTRSILASGAVTGAAPSVVRVLGTACGLGIEGSGWVVGPGLVVTNAHVVAGESDTVVEVHGSSPDLHAHALVFDVTDDIAILRVPGLSEPALTLARNPRSGTAVAILGYPEDGPFTREPGRIGQAESVSTENAYGQGPVTRSITPLRGLVRPGNSGGPLIDAGGQVMATVFAAITGGNTAQGPGGFAVPNRTVERELRRASVQASPVGTGQCAG